MGLLSKRAGGDVSLSVPSRASPRCLFTCNLHVPNVCAPARSPPRAPPFHETCPPSSQVRNILHSPILPRLPPAASLPSAQLPLPELRSSVCSCMRLSLSCFSCCSRATSDDLFHPIWNSTSCFTVTVCAKHTFYMPSILKEKKQQDRLFRKWQIPPLSDVAENYLHSHAFTHKNIILCLSRSCILCTPEMLRIHVRASACIQDMEDDAFFSFQTYLFMLLLLPFYMLLSFYAQACCVSLCFSALSICLLALPIRISSLFYCSSPSLMFPHSISKNVKSKSLICPIYLLSAELSQSH